MTYSPRSDMGYWGEGTKVVFSLRNQILAIIDGLVLFVRDPHILPMTALIVVGFLIVLLRLVSHRGPKPVSINWLLLIPGIVGPCFYLLISVEPRYVAPFFLLILLGLLPGVALGGRMKAGSQKTMPPVAIATCLLIFSGSLVAYHLAGFPRGDNGEIFLQAAAALNQAGVQPRRRDWHHW